MYAIYAVGALAPDHLRRDRHWREIVSAAGRHGDLRGQARGPALTMTVAFGVGAPPCGRPARAGTGTCPYVCGWVSLPAVVGADNLEEELFE